MFYHFRAKLELAPNGLNFKHNLGRLKSSKIVPGIIFWGDVFGTEFTFILFQLVLPMTVPKKLFIFIGDTLYLLCLVSAATRNIRRSRLELNEQRSRCGMREKKVLNETKVKHFFSFSTKSCKLDMIASRVCWPKNQAPINFCAVLNYVCLDDVFENSSSF